MSVTLGRKQFASVGVSRDCSFALMLRPTSTEIAEMLLRLAEDLFASANVAGGTTFILVYDEQYLWNSGEVKGAQDVELGFGFRV